MHAGKSFQPPLGIIIITVKTLASITARGGGGGGGGGGRGSSGLNCNKMSDEILSPKHNTDIQFSVIYIENKSAQQSSKTKIQVQTSANVH